MKPFRNEECACLPPQRGRRGFWNGPRLTLVLALAFNVVAGPLGAEAQSTGKLPKIGLLLLGTPETDPSRRAAAFREGLRELRWIEGQNILLESRYAPGDLNRAYRRDQLIALATELAHQKVDAIVAFGTPPSLAARQVTTTIPIVMAAAENPVELALVASLARPGGERHRAHPGRGRSGS